MGFKCVFYRLFVGLAFLIIFFVINTTYVCGISVMPLRQIVSVLPGKSTTLELQVTNNSLVEKTFDPAVDSFTIDDANRPVFGADSEAVGWVTPVVNHLVLKSGENGKLLFKISVPPNTSPASYFLGLFAVEKGVGGQIRASSRAGTLLFLYVAGEIRESFVKESFATGRKIYTRAPVVLSLTYLNNGNVFVVPNGELVIKNFLGQEVFRRRVNEAGRKILPYSEWKESVLWEDLGWTSFGPHKARLLLSVGGRLTVEEENFWILTPFQASAVAVILIMLIAPTVVENFLKKKN